MTRPSPRHGQGRIRRLPSQSWRGWYLLGGAASAAMGTAARASLALYLAPREFAAFSWAFAATSLGFAVMLGSAGYAILHQLHSDTSASGIVDLTRALLLSMLLCSGVVILATVVWLPASDTPLAWWMAMECGVLVVYALGEAAISRQQYAHRHGTASALQAATSGPWIAIAVVAAFSSASLAAPIAASLAACGALLPAVVHLSGLRLRGSGTGLAGLWRWLRTVWLAGFSGSLQVAPYMAATLVVSSQTPTAATEEVLVAATIVSSAILVPQLIVSRIYGRELSSETIASHRVTTLGLAAGVPSLAACALGYAAAFITLDLEEPLAVALLVSAIPLRSTNAVSGYVLQDPGFVGFRTRASVIATACAGLALIVGKGLTVYALAPVLAEVVTAAMYGVKRQQVLVHGAAGPRHDKDIPRPHVPE